MLYLIVTSELKIFEGSNSHKAIFCRISGMTSTLFDGFFVFDTDVHFRQRRSRRINNFRVTCLCLQCCDDLANAIARFAPVLDFGYQLLRDRLEFLHDFVQLSVFIRDDVLASCKFLVYSSMNLDCYWLVHNITTNSYGMVGEI